jgi:hypothetical protein
MQKRQISDKSMSPYVAAFFAVAQNIKQFSAKTLHEYSGHAYVFI